MSASNRADGFELEEEQELETLQDRSLLLRLVRYLRPYRAQVALALILMVGAGLLTRSFRAELAVDTGSEIEQIAAMRMQLPNSRYDSQEAIINFAAELERRVAELPGVLSASLSSDLPFRGGSSGAYIYRRDAPEERIRFHRHSVSPGYFETLGVELLDGPLAGLMARAVVVIDSDGVVKHTELVGEIADEPDYDAALGALS